MNLLIHVPTLSVMGILAVFLQRGCMDPLFRVPTLQMQSTQPMLSCDYVSFMIAFLHIFSNFADYG